MGARNGKQMKKHKTVRHRHKNPVQLRPGWPASRHTELGPTPYKTGKSIYQFSVPHLKHRGKATQSQTAGRPDLTRPQSSCKIPLTSTAPCADTKTCPCGSCFTSRTYKSNSKAVPVYCTSLWFSKCFNLQDSLWPQHLGLSVGELPLLSARRE